MSENEKIKQKRRRGDRKEAVRLREHEPYTRMMPYLSQSRDASSIFFKETVDATNMVKFVQEHDKKYSYFGITLSALVRTLSLRPHLNRFVQGHRHYQRNKVVLSFVAKKKFTEDAPETNVKISFDKFSDLNDVTNKLSGNIKAAKSDNEKDDTADILNLFKKLPRFFIRIIMKFADWLDYHGWYPKLLYDYDPTMCSAFITNLGSIGLENVPFHHLFDRGTCSLFLAMGKIYKKLIYVEGEGFVERDVMEIAITLDERISNGFYYIKAIELLRDLIENPEKLLEKPKEVPNDF